MTPKSAPEANFDLHCPSLQPSAADDFIAQKHLGERIRRLRLKKSMGLVELGRQTGLSASFLSQLETGRIIPTLRNLARIAIVFSKDLSYFFESPSRTVFHRLRRVERNSLPEGELETARCSFESLAALVPERRMDPYLAEFLPLKPEDSPQKHHHPGFEFLYVIEGGIRIVHGDTSNDLDTGDSVYFDASIPHSYECIQVSGGAKNAGGAGSTPSRAILVTVPQPAPR